MTVARQLRERKNELPRRYIKEPQEDPSTDQPPRDPFISPFDRVVDLEHKGFVIRRERNYQLWYITKDNREVTGLHGRFTTYVLAQNAIDDFLSNEEEKTKSNANARKAKNNKTST